MAGYHPVGSITNRLRRQPSGLTPTPLGFRHRYLTRRKRPAAAITRLAAGSSDADDGTGGGGREGDTGSRNNGGGGGGGSGGGGGRVSGGDGGSTTNNDVTGTGSFENQPRRPLDDEGTTPDMQVDGNGAAAAAATSEVGLRNSASVVRWSRVLSCPAGEHPVSSAGGRGESCAAAGQERPSSGAFAVAGSADNVSWARGITMGDVDGSVRAKTAPGAESKTASASASPSSSSAAAALTSTEAALASTEATTASAEAAVATVTATAADASTEIEALYADPAASEVVTLSLTGGDPVVGTGESGGVGDERTFRATSSAATLFRTPAPEASGKRAKSGAEMSGACAGITGAWTVDKPAVAPLQQEQQQPTATESMSSLSIDAARGAAAAVAPAPGTTEGYPGGGGGSSGVVAASPVVGCAVTATEAGATAPAATVPALSNDEWVARLSPLLQAIPPGTHPEDFLHDILRRRGYSTEMAAMKETVFHRAPEPDQVSAYDKAILSAVLDEDEGALERMRVAGRRMDACNRFGDSVLHMACRRGRAVALRFLLRATGAGGVMLSDDFGRTVMHDACWTATPRFDVASAVLDADTRLLRTLDSRGSSPLQYVPRDQWPLWCAFFESRKEVYWPQLDAGVEDTAGIIPLTVPDEDA